jgi:hypothetical protein
VNDTSSAAEAAAHVLEDGEVGRDAVSDGLLLGVEGDAGIFPTSRFSQ